MTQDIQQDLVVPAELEVIQQHLLVRLMVLRRMALLQLAHMVLQLSLVVMVVVVILRQLLAVILGITITIIQYR